jgi:hypothetical protein
MRINSTAQADAAIARLAAANRESFERLMELENHAGHAVLRAGTATGSTRARWEAAQADLAELWELHQHHAGTLDALRALRALRAVRGRRGQLGADDLARIRRLFDGADVPEPPRSTDEVAAAMVEIGARVLDVLRGVEEAWGVLGSALDRCAADLDAAEATLADLGVPPPALRARLDALRAAALDDPLAYWTGAAVDTTDVEALAAECARTAEAATELAALRARAADVLAEADAAVARLEEREWAVTLSRARLAVAVTRPAGTGQVAAAGQIARAGNVAGAGQVEAVGQIVADVRAAAARAHTAADGGDWRAFGRAVADLHAAEAAVTARLNALLAAGERPLRTRAELRSLLDLYRVKAVAAGRGEDVELDRLHRAADDLLWTAPTDLAASTTAVDAYRNAVLAARGDTP